MLQAGAHTLSAAFTPRDADRYTAAHASVPLTVTQATPIVTWPAPAAIAQGAALGADQLNAPALVRDFRLLSGRGRTASRGNAHSTAVFTPTDAADYAIVQATASLTVTKAMPEIVSPPPAAISEDVALAALSSLSSFSQHAHGCPC